MAKTLTGTVVSNSMQNTIVVEIVRRTPHPLYKKLMKRSKKVKADTKGTKVEVGSRVIIAETKPISKDKHFVLVTEETKETPVVHTASKEQVREKPVTKKKKEEAK